MKALVKLFIYCSIIAVIDLCHNPVMVNANPANGDLKGQDKPPEEAPKKPPQAIRSRREVTPKGGDEPDVPEGFRARRSVAAEEEPPQEPPQSIRARRDISPQSSDEPDVPKELRTRRNVSPQSGDEPDAPQGLRSIRARRDVSPQSGDEPDVPKELRTRRNVSPQSGDEPDAPQGLRNRRSATLKYADEPPEEVPQEASVFRAKRQMPSPPDGMPDPPSPPSPPMPSMLD
ncbi:uncharacterized protein [Musca autumnalis]|uniref:uncharacterized protein n=1 Tax=Musca autumnalis TaxID=221902 RepID=UPI003CF5F0FF